MDNFQSQRLSQQQRRSHSVYIVTHSKVFHIFRPTSFCLHCHSLKGFSHLQDNIVLFTLSLTQRFFTSSGRHRSVYIVTNSKVFHTFRTTSLTYSTQRRHFFQLQFSFQRMRLFVRGTNLVHDWLASAAKRPLAFLSVYHIVRGVKTAGHEM